jgi:NAD(P)-dependent dehydrogenase (short-subunit alcohol dehydrogenase family)
MGRLEGKIAMVTGAGGEHGLGRAIAQRFADEGADLILTDVISTGLRVSSTLKPGAWGGIEAVADEIRKRGPPGDDRAGGRSIGQRDGEGGLGSARRVRAHRRPREQRRRAGQPRQDAGRRPARDQWDTVLDTNLKGTFITSQAVARTMLAGRVRGRIISMSSQWGKKGGALRAAYCASKFGIIGFTQSLAQELAPAGITVNAICPSAAETERLDHMGLRPDGSYDQKQREERIKNVAAGTPLGRIARPSDVAEVAAFPGGRCRRVHHRSVDQRDRRRCDALMVLRAAGRRGAGAPPAEARL